MCFSYSEREGTPAARIPHAKQVPVPERKERNKKLRERAAKLQDKVMRSRIGEEAWVLPESRIIDERYRFARAEDYLAVLVPKKQAIQGRWLRVRYTELLGSQLLAKVL